MSDELRVDPGALRHAGIEITNQGETLDALQRSCHSSAQDARTGWAGISAEALSGLLDSWATAGAAHIGRIAEYAHAVHRAATKFALMDRRAALAVAGVPAGVQIV